MQTLKLKVSTDSEDVVVKTQHTLDSVDGNKDRLCNFFVNGLLIASSTCMAFLMHHLYRIRKFHKF